MRRASILAALCALIAAPGAAAQFRVVPLPWPPALLPKEPPLAPATSGLPPVPIRFFGRIGNRERVVVGIDERGAPRSVRVLQTITLGRLGDYVLAIPAPVLTVAPGPGTQSSPGQRQNQILWEGFSPGRRVLSAWADLRLPDSRPALPLSLGVKAEVNGKPLVAGETQSGDLQIQLTAVNETEVEVKSFTADPEAHSLAQVLDRIRDAIQRNVFAEGLNIGINGKATSQNLRVAAPLRVEGTLTFAPGTTRIAAAPDGVVKFSGLLDGLLRKRLRVDLHGQALSAGPPKIELRVTPASVADPLMPIRLGTWLRASSRGQLGDRRRLLARAIVAELTYARKRQYDMFLVSPEPTGPSSTSYVYRTAAAPRIIAGGGGSGGSSNTVALIVLAIGLAVAVPASAVIWAHS